MFGLELNEKLGKVHFWIMFIAFNSTFAPLFALGLMGMPRRVVTYAPHLQTLNDWVSISAFVLGASMLVFLYNVVYSLILVRKKAPANPWGIEVAGVADSEPGNCLQLRSTAGDRHLVYDYGVPVTPAPPASPEAPAAAPG